MSEHQLEYCKRCTNKSFGKTGIVCGLTNKKPTFEESCIDYQPDPKIAKREAIHEEKNREVPSFEEVVFGDEDISTDEYGRKRWIFFIIPALYFVYKFVKIFI